MVHLPPARRIGPIVALALCTTACVPHLDKAPAPRTAAGLASAAAVPAGNGAWPGDGWWRGFGDPELDRLVGEGLAGSPDVAAAAARIARAEGEARRVGAALQPTLGATASGGASKLSYNNGIPADFVPKGIRSTGTVNLQAGLNLDLFGRNRANRRAALNERDAARIDAAQARLALAAAIASAYADLARLYAERDVAVETVRVQRDSATLVAQRVTNGLDTEGERSQADANIPAAQVDVTALDETIDGVRHQIAALLGAGPDRGLAIPRPKLTALAAQALPGDAGVGLVGRRPDLAAARLRAEAAAQRVKAAKAAFYPDISISGLIGVQSLGLSYLIQRGSLYGNAGPALSLPIFDGGARAGDYRVADAEYRGAVADYDRTLIGALREVADAVTSRASLAIQRRDAAASLAQSENAYRIARLRYEGGLSTYLSVLSAESAVVAARRRDVDLAARGLTLDIALVRALGGGFVTQ